MRRVRTPFAPISRAIHVCSTIQEFRAYRRNLANKVVGFVPTMGALHAGHQSLALQASKECDVVVGSIFVNPTQFGPQEDLDKYPRTLERDLEIFEAASVACVFAPRNREEMYGSSPLCHVEPAAFSHILEGIARPDFFRGVATVVTKLFNIVQPDRAYFGQKDISQCILIQRMVADLNFPIEVRICETIREHDGLAMSSRNVYLSATERAAAGILYKALTVGKDVCETSKSEVLRSEITGSCEEVLRSERLISKVEYISVASIENMEELSSYSPGTGFILSAAVKLGNVRLIDNILVGSAKAHIFGIK